MSAPEESTHLLEESPITNGNSIHDGHESRSPKDVHSNGTSPHHHRHFSVAESITGHGPKIVVPQLNDEGKRSVNMGFSKLETLWMVVSLVAVLLLMATAITLTIRKITF
ncbi:hypothetical protein SISSUDRAFT_690975 [Sistotremastrum suecicum HHB10207 ss-3]|uniref:Uncharacterized protein n=1 Tax=Sistotremastrum suecicum HHB10207 ss-3 TaxID=1314776 RepID=A0A166I4G2_9AGAM|nr:hypothetical protein SISSUDRAFT_690975 [Sistotremastrum suecicum HHB10207 ss-3]